jgi:hypothetical protein
LKLIRSDLTSIGNSFRIVNRTKLQATEKNDYIFHCLRFFSLFNILYPHNQIKLMTLNQTPNHNGEILLQGLNEQ